MKKNKKIIPQIRFKEFENDDIWEQYRIEDIFRVTRGNVLSATKTVMDKSEDMPYPVYSSQTKNNGLMGYYNKYLFDTAITWTTDGANAGTVNYRAGKFYSTNVNGVLLSNEGYVSKAVAEILNKIAWKHVSYIGNPKLMNNVMSDIEIFLPKKIEELNKISILFDKLDKLINLQQRKLAKSKDLKSAYLSDLFPKEGEKYPKLRFQGFTEAWEKLEIEEVALRYDNLRIPIKASNRIEGNTPYYGANGIQDYVEGFTHDGEFVLLAEDGANDLSNYPVNCVEGKIWVNNHAHVLQTHSEIADNKFLMNALKNINMKPYLVGGGRAKLNADVMMKILINLPSLEEQEKIGKFFKQLDDRIELEEKKLTKLEKIKEAYLNELFV